MRTIVAGLAISVALGMSAGTVEAKGKKKPAAASKAKKAAPAATKENALAVEKLMGGYKWGMSSSQVLSQLEKDIRNEMEPVIKGTQDPLAQDRVRREMFDRIKTMKAAYIRFEGKQTPWDVSLVDKEFAHKNNESMAVVWGKTDRRFYLFHNDRLWKIYIAFNAELYEGKSFEDFAQVMEQRFGRADRKYAVTIKGDQKMSHLSWPSSATTILRAIDNTGFYGNFCLVLTDKNELPNVRAGRKVNSPKKNYNDPLVEAVTRDADAQGDANEDIVDRVTGKTTTPVPGADTAAPVDTTKPGKGHKGTSTPAPTKAKKVDSKNPLDGLDI